MLADALELVAGEITLEELAEDVGLDRIELEQVLLVQQVPQTTIDKFKLHPKRAKVTRFVRLQTDRPSLEKHSLPNVENSDLQ